MMSSLPSLPATLRAALLGVAALLCSLPVQAQIAYRSAATASAIPSNITATAGATGELTACGSVSPAIPAGNVGDLLITQVIARNDATTVAMSGWNTLFSDAVSGQNYKVYLFWRSATGSDTSTVSQSGTCNHLLARVTRFQNVDTAQPLETQPLAAANWSQQLAGAVNTGSQAVNVANSALVMAVFVANDRTTTQDASFTQIYDTADNSGNDAAISLNYRIDATTGSKGPFTNMDLSGTGNDYNHGVLFAVRPATAVSLTITKPAGTVNGDVLIASIAASSSTATITPPSGWTLVNSATQSNTNPSKLSTYSLAAGASEPASYTWTASGSPDVVGSIAAFSGVDSGASMINVQSAQATGSALTHAAASITTTVANTMLVSTHVQASSSSWTIAGMTEVGDVASRTVSNAAGISMEMNYLAQAAAGASGAKTATANANADFGATQMLALTPASPTCTSAATGNWATAATWVHTNNACNGPTGTPGTTGTSNPVVIASGHTVTLNTSPVAALPSLTISGGTLTATATNTLILGGNLTNNGTLSFATFGNITLNTASQWTGSGTTWTLNNLNLNSQALTFNASDTFTLSLKGAISGAGTLNADAANTSGITLDFSSTGGQTVPTTGMTYPNLSVSGGNTKTPAGGTLDIRGNFSVGSSTTFAGNSNNPTVNLKGNFSNSGTFNAGTGVWTLNGSSMQTVSGTPSFSSLTVNNSNGVNLSSNATVSSALALTSGIVATSSSTVLIYSNANCATSPITRTSGYIDGNVRLSFPSGTNTCTFPVGSAGYYAPIGLTAVAGSAGTLTGTTATGDHPSLGSMPSPASGIDSSKSVNRYWTLKNPGSVTGDTLTTTSYGLTLNFSSADIDSGASYYNFIIGTYTGSWTNPADPLTYTTATSVSSVSGNIASGTAFAVGESSNPCPITDSDMNICFCDNFGRTELNPSTIYGSDWVVGNTSGTFGNPVINSNGLRLTNNSTNVSTVAVVPGTFPAAGNKVTVQFKHYAYNGTSPGADGIAITLSDSAITPVAGAYGGSLGYAQKTGINGFAGGWLGVGIDEFGNYSNPTEGRVGGPGFIAQSVSLRGSGSGSSNAATNYPFLVNSGALSPNVDDPTTTSRSRGHLYKITVDARAYNWNGSTGTKTTLVKVERDTTGSGSSFAVLPNLNLPDIYTYNATQANVPVNWKISFTGATGANYNIHDLRSLKICSSYYTAPGSFDISPSSYSALTCATPGGSPSSPIVTVTAKNSSGIVDTAYTGTVTLTAKVGTTTSATATWRKVGSVSNIANGGSYTFTSGDAGVVQFYLTDTATENLTVTVADSSASSTNSTPIVFSNTGSYYAITDADSLTTGVVAGRPHLFKVQYFSGCSATATTPSNTAMSGYLTYTGNNPSGASSGSTAPRMCAPLAAASCSPAADPAPQTCANAALTAAAPATSNLSLSYSGSPPAAYFCLKTTDVGSYTLKMGETAAPTVVSTVNPTVTARPFAIAVYNLTDGSTVNPGASTATGSVFTSAGTAFSATLTGYRWSSSADANADGLPDTAPSFSALAAGGVTPSFAQNFVLGTGSLAPATGIGGATAYLGGSSSGVSVGSSSFSNGSATAGGLTYGEVGSFALTAGAWTTTTPASGATPTTYLGASMTDWSSRIKLYTASASANASTGETWVGRFKPAYFTLGAATLTPRSDIAACSASTFTYMGEPMLLSFALTPKNASGGSVTNYRSFVAGGGGDYSKFPGSNGTAANWTSLGSSDSVGLWMLGNGAGSCKAVFGSSSPYTTFSSCTGTAPTSGAARVAISGTPSVNWDSSGGTFSASVMLNRGDTPDGPYATLATPALNSGNVSIGAWPVDSDGVSLQAGAKNLDANQDATNERALLTSANLMFGRLRLDNAYGSETLDIKVPVYAEYYNSSNSLFARNTADSCTTFPTTALALGNYLAPASGTAVSAANMGVAPTDHRLSVTALSGGSGFITLGKPSPTATGSLDLVLNLGSGYTSASTCELAATDASFVGGTTPTTSLTYLLGNWCGSNYDRAPTARIKFGTTKQPYIYLRERY